MLDQPAHVHQRVLALAHMRQTRRHLRHERDQPLARIHAGITGSSTTAACILTSTNDDRFRGHRSSPATNRLQRTNNPYKKKGPHPGEDAGLELGGWDSNPQRLG
jgi:hypothetical protein